MNRYLITLEVAFLLGIAIFGTDGFGVPLIRNYGGDALAVIFLYAGLSLFWRTEPFYKAAFVFGVALSIEILQIFISAQGDVGILLFGTTFDVLDVIVYGLTLSLTAALDSSKIKRV